MDDAKYLFYIAIFLRKYKGTLSQHNNWSKKSNTSFVVCCRNIITHTSWPPSPPNLPSRTQLILSEVFCKQFMSCDVKMKIHVPEWDRCYAYSRTGNYQSTQGVKVCHRTLSRMLAWFFGKCPGIFASCVILLNPSQTPVWHAIVWESD